MSVQDQYGENLRQTQEAWVKAVESWTSNVQKAFGQASSPDNPFAAVDPNTFIDQYFDVAQETLEAQREVAKNMARRLSRWARPCESGPNRSARARRNNRSPRTPLRDPSRCAGPGTLTSLVHDVTNPSARAER
jgi:hypothetical protein